MAGVLLERGALLERARLLLEAARAGRGGALAIVGDAGLGKTTLLDAVRRSAGGFQVISATADASEAIIPFGLVHLLSAAGPGAAFPLPEAVVGALEARSRMHHAAVRWLEEAAATGAPLLVLVDDLQWSDPDSLALLRFLSRRLGGLRVAMVMAARPWPPAARRTLDDLARGGVADLEVLAPLTRTGTRTLLERVLQRGLDEAAVERAWHSCRGNPFLVEHLAAELACASGGTPAPGLGERALLPLFAGVSAGALRMTEAAAVLGTRFRPVLAARLAGLDATAAEEAFESLRGAGLVRDDVPGFARFAHALLEEAVYRDLSGPRRHRLHQAAFSALLAMGLEAEAADHAILAPLVGDASAVAVVTRAGRAALAVGAAETGDRLLRGALDLAGAGASVALQVAAAEADLACGRPAEAAARARGLTDHPEADPALRVRLHSVLARAAFQRGDVDDSLAQHGRAARAAAGQPEALRIAVVVDGLWSSWLGAGPGRTVALAEKALGQVGGVAPGRWAQVEAIRLLSATMAGRPPTATELAHVTGMLTEPQDEQVPDARWAAALAMIGASTIAEHFPEASRAYATARIAAERTSSPPALAMCATVWARTLLLLGRVEEALASLDDALALGAFSPVHVLFAMVGRADVLLTMGRDAESRALCHAVEGGAARQGQVFPLVRLWLDKVVMELDLTAGRAADAARRAADAAELAVASGILEPCAVPWRGIAIRAAIELGDLPAARRQIADLERLTLGLRCVAPRVTAELGHARLELATGSRSAAAERARAALMRLQAMPTRMPLMEAEALTVLGRALRGGREIRDAREALTAAVRIAEDRGAATLAAAATAELAVGGGTTGTRRADPSSLTAQEERVARLAADGMTNREIAGRLFLSSKTVDHHLQRVYGKLGMRSRRELMLRRTAGPV